MAVQTLTSRLQMLLLLLLLTAATAPAENLVYVNIVEGVWEDFDCQYDAGIDKGGPGEAALFLLAECSAAVPTSIPADGSSASAAAVLLGQLTRNNPTYQQKFGTGGDGPFLNPQHPTASRMLRLRSAGGGREIAVSVGPEASGQCLVCAQSAGTYSYSETRRARVRTLRQPTVWLSVSGKETSPSVAHLVRQNDNLIISCSVTGDGKVTARLLKDGVVLREIPDEARQDLARADPSDSGLYRCEGTSDLEALRQRGLHFATTNFSLAVKFEPKFDVDEIVRYTPVGQQESIRLRVRAYPEPQLACRADPPEAAEDNDTPKSLASYDKASYYAQYRLIYSNLDRVRNLTRIQCTATNEIGQSSVEIVLTAKAPRPQITSDGRTSWWNSYHLSWQHHVNASIDSYRIQIVYLQPNGSTLNTTETTFAPGAKLGHVAMVSSEDDRMAGHRRHNGVVFNLLPEAAHDISLQSCNRHGCSEFSPPVRVRTAAQSDETFNDPDNPKYQEAGNTAAPGPVVTGWILPLVLILASRDW